MSFMEGFGDVPNPMDADAAAAAAGIEAALAATAVAQAQSAAFMVENGAAVIPGHSDTVGPGGSPADSDIGGPDASDG